MIFFNKNKKQAQTPEKPQWHTDLKRTSIEEKKETQQGFDFHKKHNNKSDKSISGIKSGLSLDIEKISNDQIKILKKCNNENTALALMKILGRSNKTKFKQNILTPLVESGFFELTVPDKPRSPKQKYRLTELFVQRAKITIKT